MSTPPAPASDSNRARFTLGTWNAFGAAQGPLALLRGRGATTSHRLSHPELDRTLGELDILCMQEVWLAEATEAFRRAPLPHRVLARNHVTLWPPTGVGSGLGVASRFPLVRSGFRDFSRPHVGPETFARKGLAHVRVRLPAEAGLEADVITTHLQAGYGPGERAVRARQLRELRAFADEVGAPDRPLIVCGDMNVDGLRPRRNDEYSALLGAFEGYVDVFADHDSPTYHPVDNALARAFEPNGAVQRLDYVLLRASGRTFQLRRAEVFLERPLPARLGFPETHASDHYGLRVELGIEGLAGS